MDYRLDLDPTHSVIRLTVTTEMLTPKLADDIHIRLARRASSGGQFAAIVDLSGVTSCRLSADEVIRPGGVSTLASRAAIDMGDSNQRKADDFRKH